MRWATYRRPPADDERVGLVVDDAVHGLPGGATLVGLLGDDGERLASAGERARADPAEVVPLAAVSLLAPIPRPPTLRDFYAFEAHVRTAWASRGQAIDPAWYRAPAFYFSNPHAVVGDQHPVAAPPGCQQLDFELEVAAVVGREGRDLVADRAQRHLAGFCICNDWSARDLQRAERPVGLGPVKGKDFATTLGPLLVTPDELADRRRGQGYDLAMTATVSGRPYSRASLADLHWSFEEMVAQASRGTRVVPGDVIATGTCGTGCILELAATHGGDRYPWLRAGDRVVLAVERLGELRTPIAPAGGERGP